MQLVCGITVFLAYEAVYIDMEPEIDSWVRCSSLSVNCCAKQDLLISI